LRRRGRTRQLAVIPPQIEGGSAGQERYGGAGKGQFRPANAASMSPIGQRLRTSRSLSSETTPANEPRQSLQTLLSCSMQRSNGVSPDDYNTPGRRSVSPVDVR